jgi:hypothetical protein
VYEMVPSPAENILEDKRVADARRLMRFRFSDAPLIKGRVFCCVHPARSRYTPKSNRLTLGKPGRADPVDNH